MPSPIEALLINAVRSNLPADAVLWDYTGHPAELLHDPFYGWCVDCPLRDTGDVAAHGDWQARRSIAMFSQVKIDAYRADLLLDQDGALLLVECDGHDFHDRTKQQAAYDRARDRSFLKLGLATARFTGSEIVHHAEMCCSDLFAILATESRISRALLRNGFNLDGRSFRALPSSGLATRTDGSQFEGHWNPGKDGADG